VRDHHGAGALAAIKAAADIDDGQLDGRSHWAPVESSALFLAEARKIVGSERKLVEACGYQLGQSLGPLRYVIRASSPGAVLKRALTSFEALTSFSRAEIVSIEPRRLRARYHSDYPENRELCLSRQGFTSQLPTLWGLPPATFREHACIADGDDYCDYEIEWREHRRFWPQLVGLGIGGLLAAGAAVMTAGSALPWLALPLAGWALGMALESNRANALNNQALVDTQEALRDLAFDDAEARQALRALHERQSDWMKLFEEQVARRTQSLEKVVGQLEAMRSKQIVALRGVTHDLRNPLALLSMMPELLANGGDDSDELRDLHQKAVAQIEELLGELVDQVRPEQLPARQPSTVLTAELVERTHSTLRALAYGKDVETRVSATRDAPETIEVDHLRLDRVIDNLLTNAVKYTGEGSIEVELSGSPGFLSFKVSDTGRGIASEKIEEVFVAGGSDEDSRAPGSLGIGLSSVAHLLGELGGRLEVMSTPGVGSTFCARVPTKAEHQPSAGAVLKIHR
jgi:signal transduction histidine kinase